MRSRRTKLGALRFTSDCATLACELASRTAVKSKAAIARWNAIVLVLLARSMRNGIVLVDPIGSEILSYVEDLHVGEPHIVKPFV